MGLKGRGPGVRTNSLTIGGAGQAFLTVMTMVQWYWPPEVVGPLLWLHNHLVHWNCTPKQTPGPELVTFTRLSATGTTTWWVGWAVASAGRSCDPWLSREDGIFSTRNCLMMAMLYFTSKFHVFGWVSWPKYHRTWVYSHPLLEDFSVHFLYYTWVHVG